jgi:chromosome transmission fidelity protein 1
VIIDEAHNLIDTINAIHTITINVKQLQTALSQLSQYLERYKSRLLGKNIVYIKQIITIVKAMIRVLAVYESANTNSTKERISNVNEFVHELGIDHLNMFNIQAYLEKSKLSRKLNGFLDMKKRKAQQSTETTDIVDDNKHTVSSIPILNQIEALLMALTNADKDGRIIRGTDSFGAYVQYMLLNPANEFKEIVEDARSVVLAGGTMEPVSRVCD